MEKIEFEPATVGKKGKRIASNFTPNGEFPKRGKNLPTITTAKELKEFAAQLPDDLPIEGGFGSALLPVWYNIGDHTEHLEFDEAEDDPEDEESE